MSSLRLFFAEPMLSLVRPTMVAGLALLPVLCTGPIRQPAPGQNLPELALYESSEALRRNPIDERKELRIGLRFAPGFPAALQLRVLAILNTRRDSTGSLSPWSAVFVSEQAEQEGTLSHRLDFSIVDGSVHVVAYSVCTGVHELSATDLGLKQADADSDGGVDLNESGRPLPLEKRPPDFSDDARRLLQSFAERLGMGTVRITSASKSDVFLQEGGKTIPLGSTPASVQLRSGIREIVIRRHGQPDQTRKLRVTDGGERLLMAVWSDDSDPGSALVFTSPAGFRLALDGEIIGEAPVARPGVLAGVYELEIAEKYGDRDYRVVAMDRIQISGGRRAERFYPFEYYLPMKGTALNVAMEAGLWNYTSADQRFVFADFAKPTLLPGTGLSTIPLGSHTLQVEAVLPDGSASFGLYGENDRFLLEPAKDVLRLRIELAGKMEVISLAREPGKQIYVLATMDRDAGTLIVRVNGRTLYDGPFAPGSSSRLISIGHADGTALPDEILLRSEGRSGGFFYKVGSYLWYQFKQISGSSLRLREEAK